MKKITINIKIEIHNPSSVPNELSLIIVRVEKGVHSIVTLRSTVRPNRAVPPTPFTACHHFPEIWGVPVAGTGSIRLICSSNKFLFCPKHTFPCLTTPKHCVTRCRGVSSFWPQNPTHQCPINPFSTDFSKAEIQISFGSSSFKTPQDFFDMIHPW